MSSLNQTPSSNRLHIGVFGKTNSGKSSLINALTGQNVSIVADIEGTTTDPVYKPMEISPLGPCVIIDTAGFGDQTKLGQARLEKTYLTLEKSDIALLVIGVDDTDYQGVFRAMCQRLKTTTPLLILVNKSDLDAAKADKMAKAIKQQPEFSSKMMEVLTISSVNGDGIEKIRGSLARLLPEDFDAQWITGDLVGEDDVVLLVMPQDIQAPKGRLILPQVQTIRELLDKKCMTICVTTDKLTTFLSKLTEPPKLIITDSQVFSYVYEHKPKESMLTSFSVLFAAYKGDLDYYIEGAKAIDALTEDSKVLIAECCTHAPLTEDIGRVKIPRMLKKRVGEGLTVNMVSGTDFPEDLSDYDLIIQCGACMFNRKYVLSRIDRAKKQKIAMTNYGVTIAHITGILDKISY